MKIVKKLLFIASFAFLTLTMCGESIEEMLAYPIKNMTATTEDYRVSRIMVEMLSKFHYNAHSITPALSSEWFNEYFKTLDSQKAYFTQADVEEFRSYETVLWDAVSTNKTANLEFAFKVYKRYLERVRERAVFVQKCLDEEHDFSTKEYIEVNRKDLTRPASIQELHDFWRRSVKNDILQMKINKEKDKAKADKKNKDKEEPKTEEEELNDLKKRYARFFKRRAEIEQSEVLEYFFGSLCKLYDPHSTYMAPDTKENFDIDMRLSLQGIGATLTTRDSYTTIVDVVPGGPAHRDGRLKKGDKIIAVAQDGQEPVDVVEMPLNRVVSQIRGPKGTKVTLTVLEQGSRTSVDITIVRDEVKLVDKEAKSKIYPIPVDQNTNANVLVLHLPSFYSDFGGRSMGKKDYKSTTTDMLRLMKNARKNSSLDGVILDLRGNGGGSLDEAINLTGLFFPDGPVVQIRSGNGKIEKRSDTDPETHFTGPLIVMVDRFSASASEILAAALQDHGRALIVGEKTTHGKGTVQTIVDLSRYMARSRMPSTKKHSFGSLKLTIAKFYRINGGTTQEKGVLPDIVFNSLTDYMELGESRLPHALPWDEIKPMNYKTYQEVGHLLPKLKDASEKRMAQNKDFLDYQADINSYKSFRDIKEIPLNIDERKAFEKQQEISEKVLKKYWKSNSNLDIADRDDDSDENDDQTDKQKEKAVDFILNETLNIMTDYIREVKK